MAAWSNRSESPGAVGLVIKFVAGAVFGAALAAVWLVAKPVLFVDQPLPPEEAKEHGDFLVQYVPGRSGGPATPQANARVKRFIDHVPGEIAFSEEDANRWLASTFGDRKAKVPMVADEIALPVPSLRFDTGLAQLGLVFDLSSLSKGAKLVFQVQGGFVREGDSFVFEPRQVHLGSLPVPGAAARAVFSRATAMFPTPDAVRAAWAAVQDVQVEPGRIRLAIR